MFLDESQIVLGTNNHYMHVNVYIWRKDDEKYNPHLFVLALNGR